MAKAVLQKEVELLLDKPRDGGPVGEGVSPHRGAWHPLGARPPIFSPIPQRKFQSSEKLENIPGTHTHVADPVWLLCVPQLCWPCWPGSQATALALPGWGGVGVRCSTEQPAVLLPQGKKGEEGAARWGLS